MDRKIEEESREAADGGSAAGPGAAGGTGGADERLLETGPEARNGGGAEMEVREDVAVAQKAQKIQAVPEGRTKRMRMSLKLIQILLRKQLEDLV